LSKVGWVGCSVFCFVVVLAGVAFGAGGAVFRGVADALWGPSSSPVSVWVMDSTVVMGDDEWVALDVLRGDLDAIEGEAARREAVEAGVVVAIGLPRRAVCGTWLRWA